MQSPLGHGLFADVQPRLNGGIHQSIPAQPAPNFLNALNLVEKGAPSELDMRRAGERVAPARRLGRSPVPRRGQVGPPVTTNQVISTATRGGVAGSPGITASTPRHSSAATVPRMTSRSGRPYRIRPGNCHVYASNTSRGPTAGPIGSASDPAAAGVTGSGEVSSAAAVTSA